MALLLGKTHHLVLDRRAIAGSNPLNAAAIHGRFVQIGPDDLVGLRRGVGDPAGNLFHVEHFRPPAVEGEQGTAAQFRAGGSRIGLFIDAAGQVAEGRWRAVAGLDFALGEVDAAAVDAAGGAGFEAFHLKTELLEAVRQGGNGVAHASTRLVLQADMEQAAHEGARGNDHGLGLVDHAQAGADAGHLVVRHQNLGGVALVQVEVGLVFNQPLHAELVSLLVALRTRRLHRRPFAGVEHAKLDAGGVGVQAHDPTQSVDLAHDVALGQAADRRIAGHLGDGVEVLRQNGGLAAEPGRRQGRLHPGMAGAADDDIVVLGVGVQAGGHDGWEGWRERRKGNLPQLSPARIKLRAR